MGSVSTSRLSILAIAFSPALARSQATAAPEIGGGVLQLLLGLVIVIALLFASLWLLKRLSAPRGEAAGLMRVVSGLAVGARERVVVVEVGGTWLVLGVAPGRVTTLAEISPGQAASAPAAGNARPSGRDFASRLRHLLDRRDVS